MVGRNTIIATAALSLGTVSGIHHVIEKDGNSPTWKVKEMSCQASPSIADLISATQGEKQIRGSACPPWGHADKSYEGENAKDGIELIGASVLVAYFFNPDNALYKPIQENEHYKVIAKFVRQHINTAMQGHSIEMPYCVQLKKKSDEAEAAALAEVGKAVENVMAIMRQAEENKTAPDDSTIESVLGSLLADLVGLKKAYDIKVFTYGNTSSFSASVSRSSSQSSNTAEFSVKCSVYEGQADQIE